eukprot:2842462-Pleurochrysis_carterae.AAC.1
MDVRTTSPLSAYCIALLPGGRRKACVSMGHAAILDGAARHLMGIHLSARTVSSGRSAKALVAPPERFVSLACWAAGTFTRGISFFTHDPTLSPDEAALESRINRGRQKLGSGLQTSCAKHDCRSARVAKLKSGRRVGRGQ